MRYLSFGKYGVEVSKQLIFKGKDFTYNYLYFLRHF